MMKFSEIKKNDSVPEVCRVKNFIILAAICSLLFLSSCQKNELQVKDDPNATIPTTPLLTETLENLGIDTHETTDDTDIIEITETTTTPSQTTPQEIITQETTTQNNSETVTETSEPEITSQEEFNQIVLTAQSLIGIPFASGGSSPTDGFDSSGFIYYVLRENGFVNCSRSLREQAEMGNIINSARKLNPGDLVFFSDDGQQASFGGIYIEEGKMISCSMPGETVKEVNITSNYYVSNFFVGVRVL